MSLMQLLGSLSLKDWAVLVVVAVCVFLAMLYLLRHGGGCSGCSGSCAGCNRRCRKKS
mgnify:CR=1 FL=1